MTEIPEPQIFPYLVQSSRGRPIRLVLSKGIYQEISLRCLGMLLKKGTEIYIEETKNEAVKRGLNEPL